MDVAKWLVRSAVAVCLLAICVACEALIRLDSRYLVSALDASPCQHRRPPDRPATTQTDAGLEPLVFVGQSFTTGFNSLDDAGKPRYLSLGFDLDNTCTGEGQGPSCLEPDWADASHHDGVDGIDNAYGQAYYGAPLPDTAVAGTGVDVILVRVQGYSGQPDDDQVEVCLYAALGLETRTGQEAGLFPVFDGQDRWRILPETLLPSTDGGAPSVDQPRYCDENAYVSGGVLVAQFAEALWPAELELAPTWVFPAHQVVMAGSLKGNDTGSWQWLNVQVGFRVRLTDALTIASRMGETGNLVCLDVATYQFLKRGGCAVADIRADDDTASAPCDAVSYGSLVQFTQARLGEVRPPSPPLPACPTDAGIDFMNDTCDPH